MVSQDESDDEEDLYDDLCQLQHKYANDEPSSTDDDSNPQDQVFRIDIIPTPSLTQPSQQLTTSNLMLAQNGVSNNLDLLTSITEASRITAAVDDDDDKSLVTNPWADDDPTIFTPFSPEPSTTVLDDDYAPLDTVR